MLMMMMMMMMMRMVMMMMMMMMVMMMGKTLGNKSPRVASNIPNKRPWTKRAAVGWRAGYPITPRILMMQSYENDNRATTDRISDAPPVHRPQTGGDKYAIWSAKKKRLVEIMHPAWREVTVRCLCAAWRPLWPECVLQRDFEGFEELEEEAVVHEIVSLGNSMGLEVDDDVEKLVEEHNKELSTEELLELHKEENETLKRSLTSEESGEEEDKEESRIIPAKDLKDAFFCWSKLSKLAEDYHPDVGSVQKAIKGPHTSSQQSQLSFHPLRHFPHRCLSPPPPAVITRSSVVIKIIITPRQQVIDTRSHEVLTYDTLTNDTLTSDTP
ncbi:putative Tigger transposable element-derived protein 1-like 280 [Homarus americanus]|uniref:Putative Tigger transposable element-derived protein 1-like 280 n=1 Tax=Homarus americanus TaxID=6706 RepID=A0A8J5MW83_HOMAM|nr:putative Tigger transposable element-derived protein 1-like 280 [Homarus americanus]